MVASTFVPSVQSRSIRGASECTGASTVSPLTRTLLAPAIEAGRKEADKALRRSGDAGSQLEVEIPALAQRWEKEHLPRLKANLERLRTMNLARVNPRALPFLLDEVAAISRDCWAIRFLVNDVATAAMQRFVDLHARLTGGAEETAMAMLVGLPGELDRGQIGFSDLASAARAAGLGDVILGAEPDRAVAALRERSIGAFFLAALRDHLLDYGLRQDGVDLALPTWLESPDPALAAIRDRLAGGPDARDEIQRGLTTAVKTLNATRDALQTRSCDDRERFELVVATARSARFIAREVEYLVDRQSVALARLLLMRLGSRLVKIGALGRADDVFLLELDEVKAAASRPLEEERIAQLRMLVLEREARHAQPAIRLLVQTAAQAE